MALYTPIHTNFNAGEMSPTMDARIDIAKYANGCRTMTNFIPLVQGPARARSGTRFVAEIADSNEQAWLYRMEFADSITFHLEFGNNTLRFYVDHGRLETVVTPYSPVTQYTPGEVVGSGGLVYLCKRTVSGIAPPSATYWHPLSVNPTTSLAIYEWPTPWSTADMLNGDGTLKLGFEQNGDVLYIAHPSYPTKKLIRVANSLWTMEDLPLVGGPFIGVNADETVTVYASAATGSGVTLTASGSIFLAQHVGTLFLIETKFSDQVPQWEPAKGIALNGERRSIGNTYLAQIGGTTGAIRPVHLSGARYDGDPGVLWQYLHSGYGIVRITAIGGGGTSATADVVSRIPSQAVGVGNPTNRWSFSEFDSVRGYPSKLKIFRERLALFRRNSAWLSVAGAFEDFSDRDGADITPAMAISLPYVSSYDVVWAEKVGDLIAGTIKDEISIGELSSSDALGPANIRPDEQTANGSRDVRPARVNDSIIFVTRSGRKIRELRFTFESEGYATVELSLLAQHMTVGRVVQMDYQREPHSIIWMALRSGQLIAFTFNREQEVLGFSRHLIAGGNVESVSCGQAPDGERDEVWMIVRRELSPGVVKRYIEYMEKDFIADEGMTLDDAFFVDSGLTLDVVGPTVTTVSGLDHLEGVVVSVIADGAPQSTQVVTAGQITLESAAERIVHVGLDFPAVLIPMRPEGGAQMGTAQGKTKRHRSIRIRVQDSATGEAGTESGERESFRFPTAGLYTGDTEDMPWRGGWEEDGYIKITRDKPLPLTVCGIMMYTQVNE